METTLFALLALVFVLSMWWKLHRNRRMHENMRVEQNYDHQTYEDLYGNRGTFAQIGRAHV